MSTQTHPELIVMLTYHDQTLLNASELFEACRNSSAEFWGMKELPLPLPQLKELFARMHQCGKTTVLEAVAYEEADCLHAAQVAGDCGCDILMGTVFFDSVNDFCRLHQIRYMPYVGHVTGRPTVLTGSVGEMVRQAETYLAKGASGVTLLGYRYPGDAEELIRSFVSRVSAPVCVAGSVDSTRRLDFLKEVSPWGFTIGGAFVENRFGTGMESQINLVCDYMAGDRETVRC